MTKEQIIERLQDGNKRFVADGLNNAMKDGSRRSELTSGQQPYAIVLSCADSRVVPEHAFDAGLGELFVVRVAGNVANSSSLASIEYAVAHCGSKVIVVMGHEACGAVTAAKAGGDNGYSLNHLLSHITPAVHACDADASVNEIVKKNALMNAEEMVNRSSIIKTALDKGDIQIVPAYYNLGTGAVEFL